MQTAGMNIRLGLDIDPDTERTFKANFPKAEFVCKDIRQQSVNDLKPYLQRRYNRPRVFGACAPCQPFSSQNRSKLDRDGRRNLLGELHRFVKAYLPEYIFIENVPGLQAFGAQDGPFTDFIRLLKSLNYYYDDQIVMAYNYGVPQSRRRLVLLASLQGPISIPPPTHGPGTKHPNLPVVWDWISDLPLLRRVRLIQMFPTIVRPSFPYRICFVYGPPRLGEIAEAGHRHLNLNAIKSIQAIPMSTAGCSRIGLHLL